MIHKLFHYDVRCIDQQIYFNKLTYESDDGSERNTESGRRMFKAAKTRGSICKKGVIAKKLKLDSCEKTKKSEFLTLVTSAQTENIMQCPAYDGIYVDPP
ncbi:hypothetical protein AVEN_59139-1 [Araneus ventricosus]|uniref:Uncharacterized protein n=1 Tax=Araneus ventricosus TaxID=182803 RepID=A0A4Y2IIJ6_ARAVE|nr:hypothetical protein AVEN_59139-1 [Araneus ventricosus]